VKFLRGFYDFWYDFLIGDDWKIAVAVITVLGIGAVAVAGGAASHATLLTPLLAAGVAVAFTVALLIDVRKSD
jgi:hypothetical protein